MKILVVDPSSNDYIQISALYKQSADVSLMLSGADVLDEIGKKKPDIIVTDSDLGDMSGIELLQKLRSPEVNCQSAVLILSSDPSLDTKIKAYQFGADEYIVKPVENDLLSERINILIQRLGLGGNMDETAQDSPKLHPSNSKKIVFHSLRGGSGVSTIAVNTAMALQNLWQKPTIILDTAFFNGQVSMLLNISPKKNIADLESAIFSGTDHPEIAAIIEEHKSGLSIIAAPRHPTAMDFMNEVFWESMQATLSTRFEYIIVDTPHDFNDSTISNLIDADVILLVVNPEMSSLRVAVSALRTYENIGIPKEKIRVILNHNVPNFIIEPSKIQTALGVNIDLVIPHEPVEVTKAINVGLPVVNTKPTLPISIKFLDLAYGLSMDSHKKMENDLLTPLAAQVKERFNSKKAKAT